MSHNSRNNGFAAKPISTFRKFTELQEFGSIVSFIVVFLIFIFMSPNFSFVSRANIFSVLATLAFYGIVAVGETTLIIGGDIDISVGSVAGLGAVLSSYLMTRFNLLGLMDTQMEWLGVILCMIIAMLACSLIGFLNAFFVVTIKMPAFIVTIATLYIARGFIMFVTKGNPIYPLPTFFVDGIGRFKMPMGHAAGFSLPFLFFIALVVIFEIILRRTEYGRNVYAIGNNIEVARLSGINTTRIRYTNFVLLSMLASVAGMLVAAFTRQGYPPIGQGWELQIIAAVAVGGISIRGGTGTMLGAMMGIFIMNFLNNGLVIIGLGTFVQGIVAGVIIIIAVYFDTRRQSRKLRF